MRWVWVMLVMAVVGGLWLGGCGASARNGGPHPTPSTKEPLSTKTRALPSARPIQLVESFPDETSLDHVDVPDAVDVWPQMIAAASSTIDICQFYVVSEPGSALEPTISAIEAALARGVRVRLLVGAKFLETYSETPDRLQQMGVDVRVFYADRITGGVLHAKYFVIDQRVVYVGSQNFDWRALEHIQELGLRIDDGAIANQVQAIFDQDWTLADPNAVPAAAVAAEVALPDEQVRALMPSGRGSLWAGQPSGARLMVSPNIVRPTGVDWDLPTLLSMIESAQSELRLQLLSYQTSFYDGGDFHTLDKAIRGAVERGVHVRMLVADWLDEEKRRPLEALAQAGVEVGVMHIPVHSTGKIPFARVIHAKYLVVDGDGRGEVRSWLGTSNFGGDYFYRSRNLSVFSIDARLGGELSAFFDSTWQSPYRKNLIPPESPDTQSPDTEPPHTKPRHAKPRHAKPRHAKPRHAKPRHAKP